jgi:gliding motility-associated-like protein
MSVTDAGCNGSSTGTIIVNTVNAVLPLSYAINNQPQQTNHIFNNLPAGTYTIVVTDANACSVSATTTVNNAQVVLEPIASFSMCGNQDTSIFALANGGSQNYTYTFTNLNTGAVYQTNPLLFNAQTDAVYNVIATDAAGCNSNIEQFTVTVKPSPEIDFLADITSGCRPLCVTFTAFSNQPDCSYQWLTGDQLSYNTTDIFHCYQETGTFDVLLKFTSQNGCSALLRKDQLIQVEELPRALFSVTPEEVALSNATVSLYDFTDTSLYRLSWNFGDNTPIVEGYHNTHTFKDTGLYCITLTALNNTGCSDSITKCVKVSEEPTLYIPNSFTPNGDLLNDDFFARGTGIDEMRMFIFNRWGAEIFKGVNTNEVIKWDGSNAPQGVYHYVIEVSFLNKQVKTFTGAIRLIR